LPLTADMGPGIPLIDHTPGNQGWGLDVRYWALMEVKHHLWRKA
jgi:hypothetical protein